MNRGSEEGKTEEAKAEEGKTEEPAATEGAGAAAAGEAAAAGDAAAAAAPESEPDIEPTYETEMKHASIDHFKNSMGLFVDNFKLSFATTNFSI